MWNQGVKPTAPVSNPGKIRSSLNIIKPVTKFNHHPCGIFSCCGEGAWGDETFARRINNEVQTFERARTEKREISRYGEYDFINRERVTDPKYGESGATRDGLAVGHDELQVLFLTNHADAFEFRFGNPFELAARVHEHETRQRPRRLGVIKHFLFTVFYSVGIEPCDFNSIMQLAAHDPCIVSYLNSRHKPFTVLDFCRGIRLGNRIEHLEA
jgi:hypothetical protein